MTRRKRSKRKRARIDLVKTVLVVEDDEILRRSYARALRRHWTVFTAADAVEARRIARRELPDLAIVDMRLGFTTSGIELVRQLKKELPGILVALISGYFSIDTVVASVHAGADVIAAKPITPAEIIRRFKLGIRMEPEVAETPTLADAQWEHVERVLADCNGNVSEAARLLDVARSTLHRQRR